MRRSRFLHCCRSSFSREEVTVTLHASPHPSFSSPPHHLDSPLIALITAFLAYRWVSYSTDPTLHCRFDFRILPSGVFLITVRAVTRHPPSHPLLGPYTLTDFDIRNCQFTIRRNRALQIRPLRLCDHLITSPQHQHNHQPAYI